MTLAVTLTDPAGRTITAGGDWLTATPGDFVVEELSGIPGVAWRGEKIRRLGSGWIVPPVTREGRIIQLVLGVHLPGIPQDESCRRLLDRALEITGMWADKSRLGSLRVVHAGRDLTAHVQPDPEQSWHPDLSQDYLGWLHVTINLVAPSPRLYGPARQILLRPTGSGIGLRYPLHVPVDASTQVLEYGSGAVGTEAILTNSGNTEAWPVFVVSVDDPSGFRIQVGGRAVEYLGACSQSAPVTVDMLGRVTVGGMDRSANLTRREWTSIPSGGSATATLTTLQGGTGHAWATIHDTYM